MSIVVTHPTGNRNVRAVIKGLDEAGMLAEFHTTIAADPKAFFIKLLPTGFRNEWLRRTYPVSSKKIITHPLLELARMLLPKLGIRQPLTNEKGWASVDSVYHNIDNSVAKRINHLISIGGLKAVYAYEDGALATFKKAKQLGLKCIYDLPIAYWQTSRKLLTEESERLPNWAPTLGGGIEDSQAKLNRKTSEIELADTIICPSQFVMDSLPRSAGTKQVIMSPFGSPQPTENEIGSRKTTGPLRVLFAGSMGQRKGLGDLLAAFKLLKNKNAELVVMGSQLASMTFYKSEFSGFTYEPGRQHEKVLELMRSCDVLCLPSIVEGRALVMQEAMSQGLPLIITPNTGGADLIIEGSTGFLVPIRSPEAIATKISWLLDNRGAVPEMGKMAREHALTYTWHKYQQDIISGIKNLLI